MVGRGGAGGEVAAGRRVVIGQLVAETVAAWPV